MEKFEDANGRVWELQIDVSSVKKCFEDTAGKANLGNPEILESLAEDVFLVPEILASLCESQMEKHGITPEDFGRSLHGDTLGNAIEGLQNEIVNFIPNPQRRKSYKESLQKSKELDGELADEASKKLNSDKINKMVQAALAKMDQELDRKINGLLNSSSVTDSPESLE